MIDPKVVDPYEVLAVPRDANPTTIKSSYRKLVLKCHPDKFPGNFEKHDEFFRIQQAYEVLSDDTRRAIYNANLTVKELKELKRQMMEKRARSGANISESIKRTPTRSPYEYYASPRGAAGFTYEAVERPRASLYDANNRRSYYDPGTWPRRKYVYGANSEELRQMRPKKPEHISRRGTQRTASLEDPQLKGRKSHHEHGYEDDEYYTSERKDAFQESERTRVRRKLSTTNENEKSAHASRSSTDPRRSHTRRNRSNPEKSYPQAEQMDRDRAGIPAGYSYKNWDPTEEPIMLLGSVFEANSLGKRIFDLTSSPHGSSSPISEVDLDKEEMQKRRKERLKESIKKNRDPASRKSDDSADNAKTARERSIRKVHRENRERDRETVEGLQGFINGKPVQALPDTGADFNFMAESYAKELELEFTYFDSNERPAHLMGSGKQIWSIAQCTVVWRFQKDAEKGTKDEYTIIFNILKDCIFDVMIGGRFLDETSTMTVNRDRLSRIPRPDRALQVRCVNLCGTPGRRLNGVLSSEACSALPDSGAEPNLLSYEYVKRRGWLLDIFPGSESCNLLQFADGSIENTEGRLNLEWSFSRGWDVASDDSPSIVTFDVLRGCPFDVIIGQEFLDETEAFTKHIEAFQDIVSDGLSGLNIVIWAEGLSLKSRLRATFKSQKDSNQANSNSQPSSEDLINEELERRAEAERNIARIKSNSVQKLTELDREKQRRLQWDNDHQDMLDFIKAQPSTPPAATAFSNQSTNAGPSATVTAASSSRSPSTGAPPTSSSTPAAPSRPSGSSNSLASTPPTSLSSASTGQSGFANRFANGFASSSLQRSS